MNAVCHDTEYCKHILCIVLYNSPPSLLPLVVLVVFHSSSYRLLHIQRDYEPRLLTAVTQLFQKNALSSALEASSSRKSKHTADNELSCSRVSTALRLCLLWTWKGLFLYCLQCTWRRKYICYASRFTHFNQGRQSLGHILDLKKSLENLRYIAELPTFKKPPLPPINPKAVLNPSSSVVKSAGTQVQPMVTRKHAGEELTDASGERKSSEESAPFPDVSCDSTVQVKPRPPLCSLQVGDSCFGGTALKKCMLGRKSSTHTTAVTCRALWNCGT